MSKSICVFAYTEERRVGLKKFPRKLIFGKTLNGTVGTKASRASRLLQSRIPLNVGIYSRYSGRSPWIEFSHVGARWRMIQYAFVISWQTVETRYFFSLEATTNNVSALRNREKECEWKREREGMKEQERTRERERKFNLLEAVENDEKWKKRSKLISWRLL